MPEIFDPSPRRKRGSSIGESGVSVISGRRRRRRNFPNASKKQECTLSQEFNFDSDTPDAPPRPTLLLKSCNTKVKLSPSKSKSISTKKSAPLPNLPFPTNLETQYTIPQENSALSSNQSEISQMLSHFRHALLVDTRAIDTPKGRSMGNFFIRRTLCFLSSMGRRGMFPQMVVYLELSSSFSPTRMRAPMMAKTFHRKEFSKTPEVVNDLYSPLWIKPAVNSSNRKDGSTGIQVPTRFLANAFWKSFGDLDNDIQIAHRPAVANFWNRIRPLFKKNLLQSIEIAIVVTGSICQEERPSISEVSEEESACNEEQNNDNLHHFECASVQALQKVKDLEMYFTELTDADIRTYGTSYHAVSPVTLNISVLETFPAASYELGWRWLSQILSPPDFSRASIKFDLPETSDGSQCSISLDLKYHCFPYLADSGAAAGLLADLHYLTSCCIKVIQLVPISCIDANLLFGVPMKASPSFQDDEDQYHEMKALVLSLFQKLRERDAALVLLATGPKGFPIIQRVPLHQTTNQIYLLMGQSSGKESINDRSLDSSLFRYANADQMMSNGCTATIPPCMVDVDGFSEYVEKALDEIPNGLVNPFLNYERYDGQDTIHRDQEPDEKLSSSLTSHKLNVWTDESGVGSLVQPDVGEKMYEISLNGTLDSLEEKKLNRKIFRDDDEKGDDKSSSLSLPVKVIMQNGSHSYIDTRTRDSYGTICLHDREVDIVRESKENRKNEVQNTIKVSSSTSECNPLSQTLTISRESFNDAKPFRSFDSTNSMCAIEGRNEILSSGKIVSRPDELRRLEAIKPFTQVSTKEWDENVEEKTAFHLFSDVEGFQHTLKIKEAPKAVKLGHRFPDSCLKTCECHFQSSFQTELFINSDLDPFNGENMDALVSPFDNDNKNASSTDHQHVRIEKGKVILTLSKERNFDSGSECDGKHFSECEKGIDMTVLSHPMTEAQKTAFGRSLSSDDSATGSQDTITDLQNGISSSIEKMRSNQTIESLSSSDDEVYTSNTRQNPIACLKSLIDSDSDEG